MSLKQMTQENYKKFCFDSITEIRVQTVFTNRIVYYAWHSANIISQLMIITVNAKKQKHWLDFYKTVGNDSIKLRTSELKDKWLHMRELKSTHL